jgi:hypothetical protein
MEKPLLERAQKPGGLTRIPKIRRGNPSHFFSYILLSLTMKLNKHHSPLILATAHFPPGQQRRAYSTPISMMIIMETQGSNLTDRISHLGVEPNGSLTSLEGEVDVKAPAKLEGGGKWNPCYYTKRFAGLVTLGATLPG